MGHSSLYKASAPGSLFLMGEHAVLHEELALVLAIEKRITVTLIPRDDNGILISSHLGCFKTTITDLNRQTPFQWVMAAVAQQKSALTQGFELWIHSEFSEKLGFGSSAAVVVATLGVLHRFLKLNDAKMNETKINGVKVAEINETGINEAEIYKEALAAVHQVQGQGSGADVAASLYGGVLCYRQNPLLIEKLKPRPPLLAVYSGSKMKTSEVLKKISKDWYSKTETLLDLYRVMGNVTAQAKIALQNEDWGSLGAMMNTQHGLLSALGVSNLTLDTLVHRLRSQDRILGAKISGAGLGDCVIGLGSTTEPMEGLIPLNIATAGLRYES